MEINKQTLKDFRNDMTNLLKPIEDKYGVKIHAGNIIYSVNDFNIKIEVSNGNDNMEIEKRKFEENCKIFKYQGLKPEMYNQTFMLDGSPYKLVGLNPKARKNFCVIRNKNGKDYVCNAKALGIFYDYENEQNY